MKIIISILLLSIFNFSQLISQYRSKNELLKMENYSETRHTVENNLALTPDSKKSVFLAVVASLIIPGIGELYAGSIETGKYHLIAEGGLWLTYAGFRIHSNWLGKDARSYATQNSGAIFENKDDKFAVNIGNFNSTDEYNQTKLRNREYNLIYTTPDYNWVWNNDANRLRFKDLRIRSDAAKNNSKFVIGAIVVNHLISAFSAGRKAAAYNKSISDDSDFQIRTYAISNNNKFDGIGINIKSSF